MGVEQNKKPFGIDRLDVVTSSPARAGAFQMLLGADHVRQVTPYFTEEVIRKPINSNPAEWPMEMAERKALQDIAALMVISYLNNTIETGMQGDVHVDGQRVVRMYSDTINVGFTDDILDEATMVFEKPKSIASWLADPERGPRAMSGKKFEICTALTGIDMSDPAVHPATILIRISGKFKSFTIDDVKKFITKYGEPAILRAASGISFINQGSDLFDTDQPLRIFMQTDPSGGSTLLQQYPTWDHLDQAERQRILYGAIPEAVQTLVSSFAPAYPPSDKMGFTPHVEK